jgi:hypothetical protein
MSANKTAVILQPYQNYSPEDMPGEVWCDVVGYEGIYQISNLGRLKSLPRIDCRGQRRSERMLKQSFDSDKYLIVSLFNKRVGLTQKAHRLTAIAFIKNTHSLPQVNHINGIKTDNRAENLEWCNGRHNTHHAINIGIRNLNGENNGCAKLKDGDVLSILHSNISNNRLAERYRVSKSTIYRIKRGSGWRHLKQKAS